MKNKILFLGSLCLILAFGLVVIGCGETVDNKLPEVALKVERVVGTVASAKDSKSPIFIVSWKAVEGAVKYLVFTQTPSTDGSVFNVAEFDFDVADAGSGFSITDGTDKVVLSEVKYDPKSLPANLESDAAEATKTDFAVVVDFVDVASGITDLALGRIGIMAIPLRTDKEPSLVWGAYEDFDLTWATYTD